MEPDHHLISQTSTGPKTQNPTPSPGHMDDRRLDSQQHAQPSRPQAVSAVEIDGYDKAVAIDGEKTTHHRIHRKPVDEYYEVNSFAGRREQELCTNDREEVAAVASEYGEGDVVRLQKEKEAAQPGLWLAVNLRFYPLTF